MSLSWLLDAEKSKGGAAAAVGFKRHAAITVEEEDSSSAAKQQKGSRAIYAPPKDKFSGGATFAGEHVW